MTYRVTFTDARNAVVVDTYTDALILLRTAGCESIGHDGDLTHGGDRTLAWETEAQAKDDDGAKAAAEVRKI